jgi:hypothetical protein
MLAKFFAGYDVTRMLQQKRQYAERLFLQTDYVAISPQFPGMEVDPKSCKLQGLQSSRALHGL